MRRSARRLALLAIPMLAAALLVGCSGDDTGRAAPGDDTSSLTSTADGRLLAAHDLDGLDAAEIIDRLDPAAERPADLMASIRYDQLLVSDPAAPDQQLALPIEDGFYLSMAPYVETTHDCYYHTLTTCQGELVEEELDVTITGADGEVLVDETVTTYPNGFVGFWLPRDVRATVEVSYDGRSATGEVGTGTDDPTCLTTLQLT